MKIIWGVRVRVLIVALVPTLILGALLTTLLTSSRLADVEDALVQRGKALARQLAAASEYGLFAGNKEILQQLANNAAIENELTGVAIFDDEHILMAAAGLQAHTLSTPGKHSDKTYVERVGEHVLRISEPVRHTPLPLDDLYAESGNTADKSVAPLGEVVVLISLDSVSHRKNALIQAALITLAVVLAATLLLAASMSRSVTQPIRRIAQTVSAIGQGDLSAKVLIKGGGSLQILADGVNQMAERLALARDQLEQRIAEATQQLREKKDEAERANLAKSRFLAAASHDLRQPMHALGLLVAHLSEHQHPEEIRQIIRKISASASALEDLLDGLLDISKLDAGVITAQFQAFALQPVFERLATEFEATAKNKRLRMRVRHTNAWVYSDPLLFERIVQNLLTNAIRYTHQGTIMLAARTRRTHVRVEIRDSGPGIPIESQEQIFQEFVQLENPARDRSKGLGLGLAIVRRLSHLLEHPITLRSRPGRGSVFAIELPLGTPEAAPPLPALEYDDIGGHIVGIIDDDALAQESLAGLLRNWGCYVIATDSMAAFLSVLNEENMQPDALLCDYRLSATYNGLDIITHIRKRFGHNLPALLMSGDTNPELLRMASAHNIRLLHKPIRPAKLRAALRRLLNLGHADNHGAQIEQ